MKINKGENVMPNIIRNNLTKKCAGALFLTLSVPSLSAAWSWDMFTFNGDVYMNSSQNGSLRYQYRLGSGGCIRNIYSVKDGYLDLLSGSFQGETNDRVVQNVFWIHNVKSGVSSAPDQRWNVNQAGNFNKQFSPTVRVDISNGNSKTVTVYTAQDSQWYANNVHTFRNSDPVYQCTHYTGEANGVLSIRTVTRTPVVRKNDVIRNNYQAYLEHWMPFRNGNAKGDWNRVALNADANGNPTAFYNTNPNTGNLPIYPGWANNQHSGFAFTFKAGQHKSAEVLGVAFGTKNAGRASTSGSISSTLNFLTWVDPGSGIGILPALNIGNTPSGAFIDNEVKIVIRPGTSKEFINRLRAESNDVSRTMLYGSGHTFSGTLKTLTNRLKSIIGQTGVRTENLDKI